MKKEDKKRLEELASADGDAGVFPRVLLEIVDGVEKTQNANESQTKQIQKEIRIAIGISALAVILVAILVLLVLFD